MRPTFIQRSKDLAQSENGQSAVEFAISSSVLFMVLMGLLKICLAIYTYHYVSEAAREGTRYAMVRGQTCVVSLTTCVATSDSISTYVKSLGYPGIDASKMTVTSRWAGYPSGTVCAPSSLCNNPGNQVTVQVQYSFPLSIPFMTTANYNLQSTSAMIISQ